MDPFKKALDTVLTELKTFPEVKSILFFGSVQQGHPTATSDLDLFVIVGGTETWNYKKRVDDVEVEVYFLPKKICLNNLEKKNVTFVRAFSSGSPLLDRQGDISEISKIAKQIYKNGPDSLDSLQTNNLRIKLSELIRDLEGLIFDTPEAIMLSSLLVTSSLEAYCQLQNIWPVKQSRLIQHINTYNPQLGEKAAHFYRSSDPALAIEIADNVLAAVGGRLMEYEGPRVSINLED